MCPVALTLSPGEGSLGKSVESDAVAPPVDARTVLDGRAWAAGVCMSIPSMRGAAGLRWTWREPGVTTVLCCPVVCDRACGARRRTGPYNCTLQWGAAHVL